VLEGAVAQIQDVEAEPDYVMAETARIVGFRSLLAVPIVRDGVAIGSIALGRAEAGAFPERQVELLKTFADQAVIAIENVRLFKELEGRNRDLTDSLERQTATAEILRVISRSPTDVQPVFDIIGERARRLCDAEVSVVSRFDGELLTWCPSMASHPMASRPCGTLFRCAGRTRRSPRVRCGAGTSSTSPTCSPIPNISRRARPGPAGTGAAWPCR
jgi:hypothetical protein